MRNAGLPVEARPRHGQQAIAARMETEVDIVKADPVATSESEEEDESSNPTGSQEPLPVYGLAA